MKSFIAFSKKEFIEYLRTYKLFICIMIFLILGFLNPISAKYLPEIVSLVMPEGVMNIPTPTVLDSWTQFFKNVPQMGLIIFLIVFGGIVANELHKGTLINMLSKGLPRHTVVLSKFITISLVWTFCYYLSFAITFLYNLLFWTDTSVYCLFASVSFVWLFGLLMISFIILGSILTKNMAGGLLLAGLAYVISMIISIFETLAQYSPIYLTNQNLALLTKSVSLTDFIPSIGLTVIIIIINIFLSMSIFNKKQL